MAIKIRRPERVVDLCTDAALQADWEQAEAELVEARKRPGEDRLTGNVDVTRLAEKVRDLEEAMRASMVHFRLRALPRSQWAGILTRHPVGEDASEADKRFGASMGSFFDEVIPASVVAVTDADGGPVEFDPATEWEALADEITDRQYAAFSDAVFMLNRGEVSVPTSRAASLSLRVSSEN